MGPFRASPLPALVSWRRLVPLARMERLARRLQLKAAPGFEARSRRLRWHVLRRLDPAFDVKSVADTELPQVVRRQMKGEAAPIRGFFLALGLWGGATALGLGLLIGLISAVSPGAKRFFFPPNLAAHVEWQVSTTFPGMARSGYGTHGTGDLFFHTTEETNPSIVLSFPRPVTVRRVHVRNRKDCCQERALPLNVEALGPGGEAKMLCQRRAPFQNWTCSVPGVRTQRLRIKHPGFGTLHLSGIEVYE